MNVYRKSLVVAAVFGATFSMATQITSALSAGTAIDCNDQKNVGKDCPLVLTPAPPVIKPPPPEPPAVIKPLPPIVDHNPPPPPPPSVGNLPAPNQMGDGRFNPNRHHRRHQRDNVFRFSFGGFFYDQPYWQQQQQYYQQSYRISCSEGRRIVADDGFNRVRTVECDGRTFTYQARRGNRIFRVLVNSRRGTITGVARRY